MKKVNSSQFTVHRKKTVNRQLFTDNRPGQILVFGIIFLAVILILSATLFTKVASFLRFGSNSVLRGQARNVAEAGIERALWQSNVTAGSYTGETDTPVGTTGTFTVTVTNKTSSLKTITVTGYVPSRTNPRAKQTIKTDALIDNTIIAFNFAVQVGVGGVSLGQSAIINGSVYSNKTGSNSISGDNSSIITGDAFSVGTISTPYPTVQGTKHENQPSPPPMPTVDYQYWKDTAAEGGTIDCSQTPSECNLTGGGTTIIGNKKYIGNLTLGQSKIVTINGPVYITGNLDLGQSSQINLDDSFGSNSTALILDGTISVGQDATINPTTANPKGYIMIISTTTSTINIGQSGINAIVYVLEGGVSLGQSARATAIITKTLSLGQSAVLTYDYGLASTNLTGGPGGAWVIKKGTYRFSQ